MISGSMFFFALLGGILPAILWLYFWLKEDGSHPEPRRLIVSAFIGGMASVAVALFFEHQVSRYLGAISFITILLWAGIEEISKFFASYFTVLRRGENDEPIDNMVYLVTTALGFAAVENALFLLQPLGDGNISGFLITGNLRFLGSTLLHVIASGTVGVFLAFAFCQTPKIKKWVAFGGIICASLLHALFNFFILETNNNLFAVFGFVWIGVIVLLLFFERVKRINRTCVYPMR